MTDKIFPVALKLWLGFLVAFLLLGYAIAPSIIFGAIAGFAGGTVAAWWQTPGGEPQPAEANSSPNPLKKFGLQLKPEQVRYRLPFLRVFSRRSRRRGSRRL